MAAPANNGQISPPNTPLGAVGGQPVQIAPEWYRYFVKRQATSDGFNGAAFVTLDSQQSVFPNSRQLKVATGELTLASASIDVTLGLPDTGVAAGDYGDASHMIAITVDAQGRMIDAVSIPLNSDNVTEGTTNLFFTQTRARGSISGSSGVSYNSGTGVLSLDQAFARGLLSAGSHISYSSGTGAIAFSGTGVNGTFASPTSITVSDGLITAIS